MITLSSQIETLLLLTISFNSLKVVKRRMQLRHRNALPVATAKAGVGSIFRGDTKNIKKV